MLRDGTPYEARTPSAALTKTMGTPPRGSCSRTVTVSARPMRKREQKTMTGDNLEMKITPLGQRRIV